jgi:hypothetical protein
VQQVRALEGNILEFDNVCERMILQGNVTMYGQFNLTTTPKFARFRVFFQFEPLYIGLIFNFKSKVCYEMR